jgi:hypothetical protein
MIKAKKLRDPKVTKTITKAMQRKFWLHNIHPITGHYNAVNPISFSYDATASVDNVDEHRFRNSQRY